MKKVLFVCLGNICRSPVAEGLLFDLIQNESLQAHFKVESRGTSAYHMGAEPSLPMQKLAAKHHVSLISRSEPFSPLDFDNFDYILCADSKIKTYLEAQAPDEDVCKKIQLYTFCSKRHQNLPIPDPYFGDDSDYEKVFMQLQEVVGEVFLYLKAKSYLL